MSICKNCNHDHKKELEGVEELVKTLPKVAKIITLFSIPLSRVMIDKKFIQLTEEERMIKMCIVLSELVLELEKRDQITIKGREVNSLLAHKLCQEKKKNENEKK